MRLLIIRFSAIGDVAMTVPVVKALALACPDLHITMVSRPFAAAFFEGLADNVDFVGIDLKDERYQGTLGLEHVYQDLRALNPDMVADLHDVIRTKYARLRFRMAGIPVSYIDKHRKERKQLTRMDEKVFVQQTTSFEKYANTICSLLSMVNGKPFTLDLDVNKLSPVIDLDGTEVIRHLIPADRQTGKFVGIAPFAAHTGKIYPVEKMEQVIYDLVIAHPDLNILLFGGGPRDKEIFDRWSQKYPNVRFISELCNGMREELAVMQQLRCMVSMDSGNMHLASLVGTPVVSIWGATHPYSGFLGWGQSDDDIVQVDLPCRPCSIYGNKPCMQGDYPCMNMITPHDIVRKIEKHL